MNRRDVIIIAVLVNAGLLALLLVMAINTDEDKVTESPALTQNIILEAPQQSSALSFAQEIPLGTLAVTNSTADEIDNVLKDYAIPPQTIVLDEDNDDADKDANIEPPAITTAPAPVIQDQKPTGQEKVISITVKRGDSLDKIARANVTTIEAIKKASNLKNDKLNIGQVLQVPVATAKKTTDKKETAKDSVKATAVATLVKPATKPASEKTIATNKPVAMSDTPEYYTVKSGDNPWKIAKQFHVRFEDLLKLNNLNEEKARNMKIGDKIRVK
jgi:peptidoglycan endopeptidase LytF